MIPLLCFVTDPEAPATITEQALAAARGGAGWVQLEQDAAGSRIRPAGADVAGAAATRGAGLVINDRVGIAAEIGADALHVGQGDGEIAAIRDRIGPV